MKTIEISAADKPLSEYASQIGDDFVVLTSNDKPVAALVSLKNIDPECLALGTNADFLEMIEQARQEVAAGDVVSLEDMRREFGT